MELYVDGGFKNNTKYIAVKSMCGSFSFAKEIGKGGTSNTAEKCALEYALLELDKIGCKGAIIHTDMLSLPDLLTRLNLKSKNIKRNPELVNLKLLLGKVNAKVDWVPSKKNKADKLIKELYKIECC